MYIQYHKKQCSKLKNGNMNYLKDFINLFVIRDRRLLGY